MSAVSYAKVAKKANPELQGNPDPDNEPPRETEEISKPARSTDTQGGSRSGGGGKKRGHKRERREKRPSPPQKSEELGEKEAELQPANEEPVKYVDAPPPKTNPWIKGPPGPLPPAPSQVQDSNYFIPSRQSWISSLKSACVP